MPRYSLVAKCKNMQRVIHVQTQRLVDNPNGPEYVRIDIVDKWGYMQTIWLDRVEAEKVAETIIDQALDIVTL